MARIPDQELERLKEEISVVRLVEGAGVELNEGPVACAAASVLGRGL